jgi:putative tryptophan/tyrosine transport system substrate-binding protein
MRRRDFIAVLGGVAAWPRAVIAQRPTLPVIGVIYANTQALAPSRLKWLIKGLEDSGLKVGRDVIIEELVAEGRYDRLPALAAELVRRKVSIIVTCGSTLAAKAAKDATSEIPIVFQGGIDPVKLGVVASLNRPGGNITGVWNVSIDLEPKRLELLHEFLPNMHSVGFISRPTNPTTKTRRATVAEAARKMGLDLFSADVVSEDSLEGAFADFAKSGVEGVLVAADPALVGWQGRIVALAAEHHVPTIHAFPEEVMAGALASYGADLADAYRQEGVHVGRILKGAKPAELPVVQLSKIELVINANTAKALGIDIPPSLLARADEVIE